MFSYFTRIVSPIPPLDRRAPGISSPASSAALTAFRSSFGSPAFQNFAGIVSSWSITSDGAICRLVSVADGPLPLYEYQSVSGSKDANCACDGAKERQVTAVPLDWSCLPETRTGKKLYNCVHACSSMGRKSSEADAGEQIER